VNELNQETEKNDNLSSGIAVSFAIHALIISFFTLKAVFFDAESIDFSQAVRVDMVALPDKITNELPPPPAKQDSKPQPPEKKPKTPPSEKAPEKVVKKTPPPKNPKDDGVNLEKVKNQQKNALDKLKAMAALEKIKQEASTPKPSESSNAAAAEPAKVKGNILSPGSSLTGLAKLQHENFASDLDRHIKQHWSLPEWLARRDFKAQARVYIDSRGNILGRKIVKSSGNPSYDDEVLATIDRSAPFPAPPEKFIAIVSVEGILIGFPE